MHCLSIGKQTWVVTELFGNVRGKGLSSAQNKSSSVKPSSPLHVKWLIDIFFENIHKTPNLPNATMRKVMEAYAPDYAITENLLQKARSEGNISVFGMPSRNVQYCRVLKRLWTSKDIRSNPFLQATMQPSLP